MDAAAMTTLHLAGAGVDNSVTVWVSVICVSLCMSADLHNNSMAKPLNLAQSKVELTAS